MAKKYEIELWTSGDALEISHESKEILEEILCGASGEIPSFVKISGEVIAVENIARIRESRNW
jgi:hypothetical protein